MYELCVCSITARHGAWLSAKPTHCGRKRMPTVLWVEHLIGLPRQHKMAALFEFSCRCRPLGGNAAANPSTAAVGIFVHFPGAAKDVRWISVKFGRNFWLSVRVCVTVCLVFCITLPFTRVDHQLIMSITYCCWSTVPCTTWFFIACESQGDITCCVSLTSHYMTMQHKHMTSKW